MSPGGYLLSRDLSSDYHRRADVSLPGSEWDRVGPSGYDHQASVCCVSFLLQPLARVVIFACFGALCSVIVACCFLCSVGFAFSRLTSAWLVVYFFLMRFALTQGYQAFYQRLVTEGLIEVYWMLVALGSIHYCNYTCALSTWSSSTLL